MASNLTSDGLHPTSDGLHPSSDGLHPIVAMASNQQRPGPVLFRALGPSSSSFFFFFFGEKRLLQALQLQKQLTAKLQERCFLVRVGWGANWLLKQLRLRVSQVALAPFGETTVLVCCVAAPFLGNH